MNSNNEKSSHFEITALNSFLTMDLTLDVVYCI